MKSEWKEVLPLLYQRASAVTLKEFVHRCADEVCGRKPPQCEPSLAVFGWSEEEFHQANLSTKMFLFDAVTGNFDSQTIESALPDLDKQLIAAVTNCITVRNSELKESILSAVATTPGVSLVDFDWKLKWVLGSSSLSTLQEPVLSVNLQVHTKHADSALPPCLQTDIKQSTVNFELGSSELDSLISSLEAGDESSQR